MLELVTQRTTVSSTTPFFKSRALMPTCTQLLTCRVFEQPFSVGQSGTSRNLHASFASYLWFFNGAAQLRMRLTALIVWLRSVSFLCFAPATITLLRY